MLECGFNFTINNRQWKIWEVNEEELIRELQVHEENKITTANGLTDFKHQIIKIDKNLHHDQKRQTVMHELMHCYLRSYIFMPQFDEASEEVICDISANSHDIIHEIVESYFKQTYRGELKL